MLGSAVSVQFHSPHRPSLSVSWERECEAARGCGCGNVPSPSFPCNQTLQPCTHTLHDDGGCAKQTTQHITEASPRHGDIGAAAHEEGGRQAQRVAHAEPHDGISLSLVARPRCHSRACHAVTRLPSNRLL